jgi:glycerate-2-kinase
MSDAKILKIFYRALSSSDPKYLFKNKIVVKNNFLIVDGIKYQLNNGIKMFSIGKASISMTEAFINLVGSEKIIEGIIVTPDTSTTSLKEYPSLTVIKSSHPFVSELSENASHSVLQFADNCDNDDIVFCLISGGGSALLACPISEISLLEKINRLCKKG